MELVVTKEEVSMSRAELAEAEAQSAKKASRMASEAVDEVTALQDDAEMAGAWAEVAANLAGLSIGHSHRAANYAPGSRAASEARQAADKAMKFAEAAVGAAVKD